MDVLERIAAGDVRAIRTMGAGKTDLGIFDPQHPAMADEVANVRDALSRGGQNSDGIMSGGVGNTGPEFSTPCPHRFPDSQRGQWVCCGLGAHSDKVKHGNWWYTDFDE